MLPFLQKIIDSKNKDETKRICDNEIVVTGCVDVTHWRWMLLWMILFFLCKKINFL